MRARADRCRLSYGRRMKFGRSGGGGRWGDSRGFAGEFLGAYSGGGAPYWIAGREAQGGVEG